MTHDKRELSKTKNDRISNEELRAYRAMFKRKLHSIIYGAFRRLKKEENLSQKDIAERLGVDQALISKRLNGNANVTLNTLSDLARAMEVTIDASAELWKDSVQENTHIFTMDSFALDYESLSVRHEEPIRMVRNLSGGTFGEITQLIETFRMSVVNISSGETNLVKSDLPKPDLMKYRLHSSQKELEASYH